MNGQLAPVTSPVEIAAIEEAAIRKHGFEGAADHIDAALALLGKKPEPDYRNSIKESISAVEAVVKLLTGEKSGDRTAMPSIRELKEARTRCRI